MDANWWNNALQSYDVGREHRADRENAQAFQTGGLNAVADTAGRRGDLQTYSQTRRFQDDERNRGYQAMEQIAPWARNLVRATRNRPPEQSRPLLEQNAQRFVDFLTAGGADEETARRQVQAGIAGLTDPNPEVRAQWADSLDQAFQQHQDPNWQLATVPTESGQGVEQRAIAIDPANGAIQRGEGSIPVPRGEVQSFGSGGLYRENPNAPNGIEIIREPRSVAGGGGGVQYRPATPEDAQIYGLPNEGHGYVIGSNGRPMAATSGGGVFPADQRARVAIMYEPALEATRTLEQADAQALQRQGNPSLFGLGPGGHGSNTPLGQDWLARTVDGIPLVGDALASNWGGDDYQRYVSASSTFESSMLPILSGAAVTPSEATRIIRAALPRIGDRQALLQDKARRRRQMLNGAALIGGRPPPYPQDGVPDWATRAQDAAQSSASGAGGVGLESLTDEQLDQLEQELMNAQP